MPNSTGGQNCGTDLVVSVFFDKFGCNIKKESNLTIIGNLARRNDPLIFRGEISKSIAAHKATVSQAFYIPGLGTPFSPKDPLQTTLEIVSDALPDIVKDQAKDKAKETGKAVLSQAALSASDIKGSAQSVLAAIKAEASAAATAATGRSLQAWLETWRKWQRSRKLASADDLRQAAQHARLAALHQGNLARGVYKGGTALAKGAGKGLAFAAVSAAALTYLESRPESDQAVVARLLKTGADKRVMQAWDDLQQFAAQYRNAQLRNGKANGEIRVYIFGAEWGGALALKFAQKVADECGGKGALQLNGIPLRLRFVGLLDCITQDSKRSRLGRLLMDFTPLGLLKNGLDDLALPTETEECLHLYALHDRVRPLSSIAGGKGGVKTEIGLPGSTVDVCGGPLSASDNGPAHLDIAKYALNVMHAAARKAGAPLAHPGDKSPQAQALAQLIAPSIRVNGLSVHELLPAYFAKTGATNGEPQQEIARHMAKYVAWMRALYDDSDGGNKLPALGNDARSQKGMAQLKAQLQGSPGDAMFRAGSQFMATDSMPFDYDHANQMMAVWKAGTRENAPEITDVYTFLMHHNDRRLFWMTYRDVCRLD